MAEATKIEWCDSTFNPWTGCTKVSPGCGHCYAESWAKRSGIVQWGPHAVRHRTSASNWQAPLHWDKHHDAFQALHGRRRRVFCASLADVFDNAVPHDWRRDLFELIGRTQHLDWLLLTKRIGNAREMLNAVVDDLSCGINTWDERPWPGVWIGATVVNQLEADRDIPKLLQVPARVRFLSIEPMLGSVNIRGYLMDGVDPGHCANCGRGHGFTRCPNYGGVAKTRDPRDDSDPGCTSFRRDRFSLHWVICGGESGPGARPMHPDWARSLRDQCAAAGTSFLFKQWGEWIPYEESAQPPYFHSQHGHEIDGHALPDFESDDGRRQREWHCDFAEQILARRVGKRAAGRLLDGMEHNGFPGAS